MRRRSTFLGLLVASTLVILAGTSAPVATPSAAADPTPGCVVDLTGAIGWWRGEDVPLAQIGVDVIGTVGYADGAVGRGFAFGPTTDARVDGLTTVTDAVSVEMWVRPDPASGRSQALLTRWDFPSTDDSARSYSLVLDPFGSLVWSTDEETLRRPVDMLASVPAIFDGGFHHVAATWDQTSFSVYFDGLLVGSSPSQRGTLNPAVSTSVRFGAKSGLGDRFAYSGVIDEPTIWSRSLTAPEVAAIHGAGIAGKCSFVPVEQAKFVTAGNSANSRLGQSVGVSGTTVVAGAPFASGASQFAGSAYVYTTTNGITWSQQAVLIASDPAPVDFVGWSVDISGDTAVLGSYGNNAGGVDSGAAYVFTRSGTSWTQQAKLVASDASAADGFGYTVGISGDTIVVGAPLEDDSGGDAGAVYVFTRSGTSWTQQAKLTASDAGVLDNFGTSVAIDLDSVVAGSPGNGDGADEQRGAAYVYTRAATVWTEQAKLVASDGVTGDIFGNSVAIDLDSVAVGAPLDDDTAINSGSGYVFVRNAGSWSQQAKVVASDPESGDRFGFSIGIDGTRAVVGADREGIAGSQAGAAYVFDRVGSVWAETTKLLASDSAVGDQFGYSVDISGRMVVGAHLDDDRGNNAGAAYAFGP
jgi:Concanavalin A-like lectin/glucanases superfamily/FG-GAP repeat